MRARWLAAARAGLGLAAGLGLSQCFSPTYSDCAFRCGPTAPLCPAQYECRSDGYCHLPEGTAVCAAGRDLATAGDLGPDLAGAADGGTD